MGEEFKTVQLHECGFAKVDADDYEELSKYKWRLNGGGYAFRYHRHAEGTQRVIFMHRVIAETPKGTYTDHINGDRLDNRRCNLRHATIAENNRNRRRVQPGFKGITWRPSKQAWEAWIMHSGVHTYLGTFPSDIEAARVYNHTAKRLHGEFASLNDLTELGGDEDVLVPKVKRRTRSSAYYGVSFQGGDKRRKRWKAIVPRPRNIRHIGHFMTEAEAALAYNRTVLFDPNSKDPINLVAIDSDGNVQLQFL